jgi:sialate O-acetylesterase
VGLLEGASFLSVYMRRPVFLLATGLLCFHLTCSAKIILPSIFTDHMVLQRLSTVAIWGWADPGTSLHIVGSWNPKDTLTTQVDNQGHWKADIRTSQAGGPYTLWVKGPYDQVLVSDVLLGEVWLCSGQSNMEFSANWGLDGRDSAIAQADIPGIRFFHVPKIGAPYPQLDCKSNWEVCTPGVMANETAVGYFYARLLHRVLNVPVGIIQSAWGGSFGEDWVRPEQVSNSPRLLAHRYDDHNNGWPAVPGVLYNGMIAPLIPYGIKGVLWYQGESNSYHPGAYAELMDSLVSGWRKDFGNAFSFYYVQIAPYTYDSVKEKAYIVREQQDMAQHLIPGSGMVVISDLVPNVHDIHPKDKKDVGERLGAYALADTYHDSVGPYRSPAYRSMEVKGNKIVLTIDHAEAGLVNKGKDMPFLEIAGADQHFVPASGKISGNTLTVWSPSVKDPVAVRYCFSNSAVPTIFGKVGNLPLAPFRTDDWSIEP